MRINDESTRFSPQIAALAMPGESGYKAAAEGISNVGKVFQDQQDREQTSALNALKMSVAQEELKGKQFENSIAGEEWDNKKSTYVLDRRNKTLEGLKKEIEWKADVKKQTDNGFMDQFKKVVPSQTFVDPKSGKFSEELYQGARNQFKSAGGWAGENIHLFDALADGYRKESLETDKTKSEIASKEATAKKTNLEATTVIPESNAKIAQNLSSAAKNYAGANLDTVNASLSKRRVSAYEKQVEAQSGASGTKEKDLKKDRQKIVADGKLESMIPKWGEFNEESQRAVINLYVDKGVLPTSTKEVVVKRGVFGDTMGLQPIYPKGTLDNNAHNVVQKTTATPPKSAGGSIAVGTIKTNSTTGQKAQFDGHGWVLVQ